MQSLVTCVHCALLREVAAGLSEPRRPVDLSRTLSKLLVSTSCLPPAVTNFLAWAEIQMFSDPRNFLSAELRNSVFIWSFTCLVWLCLAGNPGHCVLPWKEQFCCLG